VRRVRRTVAPARPVIPGRGEVMLTGWLFDAYPTGDGMAVWLIGEDGRAHRLVAPFAPVFYVAGPERLLARLPARLADQGIAAETAMAAREELLSGAALPVLRIAVRSPLAFPSAVRSVARIRGLSPFDCDLSIPQLFFAQTGLFPLGRYRVAGGPAVTVQEFQPLDTPEDLEYALPPLVTMRLRLDGDPINPAHGRMTEIEASVNGETVVLCGDRPEDLIGSLNRLLDRYDPDVLLTEWGDAFLLPRLRALAARTGVPLRWNRERGQDLRMRRARSYVTYGQTVFTAGAQMLRGRWHLDLRNSFIYGESELAGLLEIARLACLPVQYLARTSIGTAISAMQIHRAIRRGVLVPWRKSEPEGFKSAGELLVTDKGGLTYQPVVGLFEGVGELDFASMYPTIMERFNISPETINCRCCPDAPRVPETGARLCRRRRGLLPEVLEPLLARRAYYKRRKQETSGEARALYQQRQTALKWCLVCCLDGDTSILHRANGRWKIASIRDLVDTYLPGSTCGEQPVDDLAVTGIDGRLRGCVKPVHAVIKVPAPPTMIRMRLRWGRELLMTPNHRCYVLEQGQLRVKRADQLSVGDWIPLAHSFDERLVESPLLFAPVKSLDRVPYDKPYVYCFQLVEEPAVFFVEGGVLTGNSFGYLGYRNARFGRIEAHEATTAFSREMLLRAKDLAETRGYRMLHALVDSMWLHRSGATHADYDGLARVIEETTGLPILVEGVYDWIAFLPSRTHPGLGVPNRYLGRFDDGGTKVRGIEVRRSDVPALVERTQARMLEVLFAARTAAEVRAAGPRVLDILTEAVVRLRGREVRAADLAVTTTISRAPEDYRNNAAVAARQMARAGVRLHPGERIQYVVTDARARLPEDRVRPLGLLGPDWSCDADYYVGQLMRTAETLLVPLGFSLARLEQEAQLRMQAGG